MNYLIEVAGAGAASVRLRDANSTVVAQGTGVGGVLTVPAARLWSPDGPCLYRLDVAPGDDEYQLPEGIRTVAVDGARLLLNGQPVTLCGFGMHEDAALRGKGHDDARMVRDFALLRWIGDMGDHGTRTFGPGAIRRGGRHRAPGYAPGALSAGTGTIPVSSPGRSQTSRTPLSRPPGTISRR